jgi:uncharacterized protein (TIGR02145 family)
MKLTKILIYTLSVVGVLFILSGGCKKKDEDVTVTDIDGNIYHTVTIGSQVWMAENLRTVRYRNGDSIPKVPDSSEWMNLGIGAYCINITEENVPEAYGYLYNWYAVNDTRKIAPSGWHVPSHEEWTAMVSFLGGEEVAGSKVKEIGTTHWNAPNTGATNESGFNALPAGGRGEDGLFMENGYEAVWWSGSSISGTLDAWCTFTMNYSSNLRSNAKARKYEGLSIRCIKD